MHESRFEKEVRLILESHNIPFKQNCFVCNREMDFLLDDKINIEVDGPFHETKKHKVKDAFRDRYLKSFGFRVYRIKFYVSNKEKFKLKNEENKQKLINYLYSK